MPALGIDFGTSTTVFASCDGARLEVLEDDAGDSIIPSVIAFTPKRQVQIGRVARSRTLIDPTNTLHSFKRLMGKLWYAHEARAFREQYPFTLERDKDNVPRFVTRAGKLTAADVTEQFLAHTRKFASLRARGPERIVIAVPELADRRQQNATVQAAQQAGFPEADVVSEPAAAVLSYLYKEPASHLFLVYDLGGGTFDAAVVRWNGVRPMVISSAGDSYLGGDDIDRRCAEWAAAEIVMAHRWDARSDVGSFRRLVFLCEQAKTRLSIADQTAVNLGSVDEVLKGRTLILTRDMLHALCEDLIAKTFEVCTNAMAFVGVSAQDLDGIILAGGSTYMPLVRNLLQEKFGRPIIAKLPADRVVAMGASLLAHQRIRS